MTDHSLLSEDELKMIKQYRNEAQARQLEQDEKTKKEQTSFDAKCVDAQTELDKNELTIKTMAQELAEQNSMFTVKATKLIKKVYGFIDGERVTKEIQYTDYCLTMLLADGKIETITIKEHFVYTKNRYYSNSSNRGYQYYYYGILNSYRDYWGKTPKTVANYFKKTVDIKNAAYNLKNKKAIDLARAIVITTKMYTSIPDVEVAGLNGYLVLTTKYGTQSYRNFKFDGDDNFDIGTPSFTPSAYGTKYLQKLTMKELEV